MMLMVDCQAALKAAEEIEGELSNGYSQKLINGYTTLPDPFHKEEGWKSEEGIGHG